jgi:hypothetical protein
MRIDRLAALLIMPALAASAQDQAQSPAVAAVPKADYNLAIRAKQAEVKAGSELRLEIVTRNVSDHTIADSYATKNTDDTDQGYVAYVWDEKGDLAKETKYERLIRTSMNDPEDIKKGQIIILTGSRSPGELPPGSTHQDEILLNRLYDVSQPGKYTVQVRTWGDMAGRALSNKITITITK